MDELEITHSITSNGEVIQDIRVGGVRVMTLSFRADQPTQGRKYLALFRAAPDLLAALEAARDVLGTAKRYFPKPIRNRDRFSLLNVLANAVNPAIAKATT